MILEALNINKSYFCSSNILHVLKGIDLKIKENQRLLSIATWKYKEEQEKLKSKKIDLRMCKEYNELRLTINELTVKRREIIMSTELDK